jgi:DUF1365 family protein
MFQMLLDVDEAPSLDGRLRLFSYNRPGPISFHDADHGDGEKRSLRVYVEHHLSNIGLSIDGGRILLLCMPRIFGHVFNPLSIYYCYGSDAALIAVIYEVNNTFGERHSYLIPAEELVDGSVRQSCDKTFYVSPFMDMDVRYDFKLSRPAATIATVVNGAAIDGGKLIFAAFRGERRAFSDQTLFRLLIAFPFQTLGVVAAIHWEALKLLAKGLRLRRRPEAPRYRVTTFRAPDLPGPASPGISRRASRDS